MRSRLALALFTVFFAACRSDGSTPPVLPTPLVVYPTSYENAKRHEVQPSVFPNTCNGGAPNARAYADFFRDGTTSLFMMSSRYDSTPARSCFFRRTSSGWVDATASVLPDNSGGCLHPRKALVADFNKDGKPDVFVACHGWDRPPFPGERSQLLLSGPTTYTKVLLPLISYTHGAAAGDVNGDGYPDLLFMDRQETSQSFYFFVNQGGTGQFVADTSRLPNAALKDHGIYSMEIFDIDADGLNDVVMGGFNGSDYPTHIYYGDAAGRFTGRAPTVLPTMGNCVALDYTWLSGALFTLAACDEYAVVKVQKYALSTNQASIVLTRASSWALDWLYVYQGKLVSDWLANQVLIDP